MRSSPIISPKSLPGAHAALNVFHLGWAFVFQCSTGLILAMAKPRRKTYRFHLEGSDTGQGTLQYPVLRLRDSTGQVLHSDSGSIDGAGPGWTSVLTYTAASTGTYHVSCEASGKQTGTYKVSATEL